MKFAFILAIISVLAVTDTGVANFIPRRANHAELARRQQLVNRSAHNEPHKEEHHHHNHPNHPNHHHHHPKKHAAPKKTEKHVKKQSEKPKKQASKATHKDSFAIPKFNGLISIQSDHCGKNGAQHTTTATTGPNGDIDWLNCGINGGGWQPPFMTIDDVVTANLAEAIKESGSPFKPCAPYVWAFQQFGDQYNIPPIILASFALQESSCNPNTVGGAGEQGLMQLTKDKCGQAPHGNCKDPAYNIQTGAKYFSQLLASNGGDLLTSIGNYNGWEKHMTIGKATAAAHTSCCRCQNNLDYLHQFLNGWCQNIDAYSHTPRLGKYFNLDKCH